MSPVSTEQFPPALATPVASAEAGRAVAEAAAARPASRPKHVGSALGVASVPQSNGGDA